MFLRPLALFLCAALWAQAPARAEEITVFAAASLKTALDAAGAQWQADTGHEVTLSYAATSALARQIEAGAPADLFIAASADWMDVLDAGGLLMANTRRDLFGSRIVLIAPGSGGAETDLSADFDIAARLGDNRLAMALIDSVPAGIYGKQALTSLGMWDAISSRVAQTDNVRAALVLVATGEAALGIVYATDAASEPKVQVLGVFPESSHDPIVYPGAVVAAAAAPDAAVEFLDWLGTDPARAIFAAQGFTHPAEPVQ